jgi:hypothetical protein
MQVIGIERKEPWQRFVNTLSVLSAGTNSKFGADKDTYRH